MDGHLQEVALDYDDIAPCAFVIPVLIFQASVRLHHGHLKQLFQGLKRRSWMQDEFKHLQAVVRPLAECFTDIDRRGCSLEPSLHLKLLHCQQQKTPKTPTPATLPRLL